MSRFFAEGEGIPVTCDPSGVPLRFTWRGREYRVQILSERWRIDEGWFQVRVWREYFKVATDSHTLILLYHDLLQDQWYLQRVYD